MSNDKVSETQAATGNCHGNKAMQLGKRHKLLA